MSHPLSAGDGNLPIYRYPTPPPVWGSTPRPSFISRPPHNIGSYQPGPDRTWVSTWMGHTVTADWSDSRAKWIARWGGEEVHAAAVITELHNARTLAVELAARTPFPTD